MDTGSMEQYSLHNGKVQQNNTVTETIPYLFALQLANHDLGKTKMRQRCDRDLPMRLFFSRC